MPDVRGYFRASCRMSEELILPENQDRAERYAVLAPQLAALIGGEPDPVAAMANMSAALREAFGWHWVGFYRVLDGELVLGPFQGPVACARIAFGKGVCGTAWERNAVQVVPDVDLFPGHIACSTHTRSEIVVPVRDGSGAVVAVLDIDSTVPADFTEVDVRGLEGLCTLLAPALP